MTPFHSLRYPSGGTNGKSARKGPVMAKVLSRVLVVVVVATCATRALAQVDRSGKPRNIILIGWDGAQREHVQECLSRGELPNLQALAAAGKIGAIDIRGTTDTKAGWSQILTGYDPDVTGVYSNARYQPVPTGLSVFERLKEHFGPDRFAAVAVIGKKGHCGEIDPPQKVKITDQEAAAASQAARPGSRRENRAGGQQGGRRAMKNRDADDNQERPLRAMRKRLMGEPGSYVIEENGVKYRVTPGKPYMNMSKACDEWIFGLMLDEKVGTKAIELLDTYKDKPFFFFVHFAEVDHKGHQHGENSKEYNDALISNDTWTGKIVQKLKDLKLYDQTIIYVTADHGFDEGKTGHRAAPRVFLATNDPKVCRNGDRADITPTILDRFGLDLNHLTRKAITATRPNEKDPPLAGHSLIRPLDSQGKQ